MKCCNYFYVFLSIEHNARLTFKSMRTIAFKRVDSIDARGVVGARHGQTFVYVNLTVGAREAGHTITIEID